MKLADYMALNHITPRQLRWMLGVSSRSTVMRWVRGERVPTSPMIAQIEALTGGAVTLADFHDPSPPNCMWVVLDRKGRQREVFPWSSPGHRPRRVVARPAQRDSVAARPIPKAVANDRKEESDEWPTPPIRKAIWVLGLRAGLDDKFGFQLDGRPVDARRLVAEANRALRQRGKPPIPYPGAGDGR